jgi:hypothetical protein
LIMSVPWSAESALDGDDEDDRHHPSPIVNNLTSSSVWRLWIRQSSVQCDPCDGPQASVQRVTLEPDRTGNNAV